MTVPVWVLLGFAAWTINHLLATVGLYRWSRILTGRTQMKEFRADKIEGEDWYLRAMRAQANCVENCPVYGAVVVAIVVTGAASLIFDLLAIVLLVARVRQTVIHVWFKETNPAVAVRFSLFLAQLVCMLCMGPIVGLKAL